MATERDTTPDGYVLRDYREEDRDAANALGTPVVDWWYACGPEASRHLVAARADTGEIVGHLQATDRSLPEPSRRPGQCHFFRDVAPEHRRRGLGAALYERVEAFARQRGARLLYASYMDTPDAPAAAFLTARGFEPLERYHPSTLDVAAFDPARFAGAVRDLEAQGIRLCTYAEMGDSPDHRRKLYALEQTARASQPFREVGPYVAPPFDKWEREFEAWDSNTIFLVLAPPDDAWIGVVTGLEWYFTGVAPQWRGRGIATALKTLCIAEAKRRGISTMETENHEDNAAMLAVNRRLGFIFTTPGVACVKRF